MLANEVGETIVDLGPDLVRHHRLERRARHFDGDVHRSTVAHIDDVAIRSGAGIEIPLPHQVAGYELDGALGCRKTDAL